MHDGLREHGTLEIAPHAGSSTLRNWIQIQSPIGGTRENCGPSVRPLQGTKSQWIPGLGASPSSAGIGGKGTEPSDSPAISQVH
jgi:hypothetical protein